MKRKFEFNSQFDIARSYKFEPNEVSAVRCCELPDGGVKYQSDIALLFNEERLRKTLGLDTLKKWIEHFNVASSASSKGVDISNMTDAQLMSFIKSRYIQQPSELKAWSEYINTCAEELIQDYNDEMELQKMRQAVENFKQHGSQSAELQNTENVNVN